MKINKLYTGIVLASALVITGCGGDEDSDNTSSNNGGDGPIVNNQLNYAVYDIFSDVVDDKYKTAWGKLEFTISENSIIRSLSTVVGSSTTAYQDSRTTDNDLDYYVGDKVFVESTDIFDNRFNKLNFIDSDTFKFKIQGSNGSIDSIYDIATLDLTGVSKLAGNAKTGIETDLSYDYFPSGVSFPAGSKCYILQETPEQSYYTFYDKAPREDMTIDEWIADQSAPGTTLKNLVKENVGSNNELPAARYEEDDGDIEAVVRYNGLLYNATYYQKGVQEDSNIDFKTGFVNCDQYNDVAATFLDAQIKANYNK